MKLLFIHDCPFFQEGDKYYVAGGLPNSVWRNNYLPYFDSITVIGRRSLSEKSKCVLSSMDNGKVRFNLVSEYSSVFKFFYHYVKIRQKIAAEIDNNDFTIIRLPSQFGFMAANILRKWHKPYMVEVVENGFEAYWYFPSFLGKMTAHYFHGRMKKTLKYALYAVYVAQKLKNDYPTLGCGVVISDVIMENILPCAQIQKARFYSANFKIGLIGDLGVKYKGQAILLKAISILEDDIKQHIELYFAGPGNGEWIVALAKKLNLNNNIQFIGLMPHNEVLDLLKTISLYVHPSFKEGMPRALLEAMSMGCPILGSTNGGIPEVVKAEFLHKPGDYKKLSKQIKTFYENRNLLEQESLCNLELVKPFLKENLNIKRKEFFQKIVNEVT
jgi:glycosyltransferase involved in cell wall biosynthesis